MCEKHICHILNKLRGYTQQRLKTLVENWCRKHGNAMPRLDLLLALIRCDFPIQQGETPALAPDDYDALKWWMTEVLPIRCCRQSGGLASRTLWVHDRSEGPLPQ